MTFTTGELRFLAQWSSEVLGNRWTGRAHQLQKRHGATDNDLGTMVAAWGRVTGRPQAEIAALSTEDGHLWPWSPFERFRARANEARRFIKSDRTG